MGAAVITLSVVRFLRRIEDEKGGLSQVYESRDVVRVTDEVLIAVSVSLCPQLDL